MSTSRTIRCPLCGHDSPRPASRDFLICTCGLRLACEPDSAGKASRVHAAFAALALASLVTAAVDLLRHIR